MRILRMLPGRLMTALAVVMGASILIFVAVRSLPGDFAQLLLGPLASDAAKDAVREAFRLDRSLPEQYWAWMTSALRGDFGISVASQTPVLDEFAVRAPTTALLALMAMTITLAVGIPLGVYAGTRPARGRSAVAGRLLGSIGISIPEIVLGSLVVYLFSRFDLGLSVTGFVSARDDLGGAILSLLLPALVLSVFCVAATARTTRDAVMGVLVEPHILAAVSRGERPWFIVRHHVLRNALIPVFTFTATIFAYLLGGAVLVESVFSVPGLGSYLVQGLGRRDIAVVQTGVLLATVVFVVCSLLIDVVTALVDPRVTPGRKRGLA